MWSKPLPLSWRIALRSGWSAEQIGLHLAEGVADLDDGAER